MIQSKLYVIMTSVPQDSVPVTKTICTPEYLNLTNEFKLLFLTNRKKTF